MKMKSVRANLDTCLPTAANVLQAITRIPKITSANVRHSNMEHLIIGTKSENVLEFSTHILNS